MAESSVQTCLGNSGIDFGYLKLEQPTGPSRQNYSTLWKPTYRCKADETWVSGVQRSLQEAMRTFVLALHLGDSVCLTVTTNAAGTWCGTSSHLGQHFMMTDSHVAESGDCIRGAQLSFGLGSRGTPIPTQYIGPSERSAYIKYLEGPAGSDHVRDFAIFEDDAIRAPDVLDLDFLTDQALNPGQSLFKIHVSF